MLQAAAHEFGWRTALFALMAGRWDDSLIAAPTSRFGHESSSHQADETEPFHLDDLEIASRLRDDSPLPG